MKKERVEQIIDEYNNGGIAYSTFIDKISFFILNVPKLYQSYDKNIIQEFLQMLNKKKLVEIEIKIINSYFRLLSIQSEINKIQDEIRLTEHQIEELNNKETNRKYRIMKLLRK